MNKKGAEFVKWFGPLLDALRDLGGSGTPREVSNKIAENLNLSDEEINATIASGESRFHNQVCWARQYLAWEGYLDNSVRGVWKLTESGSSKKLAKEEALKLFEDWNRVFRDRSQRHNDDNGDAESENDVSENDLIVENYKSQALDYLRTMTPSNFEKFCLLLLRENDFEELEVTGRSHDEGIDGKGILRINPLVTFKVLFQAKRYKEGNNVSRAQVGDFRNAVMGRADKGIFLTTSNFTKEAQNEADREGVIKIELVNASKLLEMMEHAEVGLKKVSTFEIDHSFFKQYLGN